MKPLKFILLTLWCSLTVSSVVSAQGLSQLEGLYEGRILMWENGREVNLRVALNLLEETDPNTEDLLKIVGVFTVDDEGGPYRFSKITLDMDSGRLDMRYTRPNRTRILNSPSHFRLVGNLAQTEPLSYSGKVLSGFYGPVGEFTLKRTGDKTNLKSVPKYNGRWVGFGDVYTGSDDMEIVLEPSGAQTINPDDFEFEFTNSKVGSMTMWTTPIGFTKVYIDYLRGTIVMINGTPGIDTTLSIIATWDHSKEAGGMKGIFNSSRIGHNGSFWAIPKAYP